MGASDRSCSAPKTGLGLSDLVWASGSKLYAHIPLPPLPLRSTCTDMAKPLDMPHPGLELKTLGVGAEGLFGGKSDKPVG